MSDNVDPSLLQHLSDEFDRSCQVRHEKGEEKYGPVKFLNVNAFEEAMAELADLANYARYAWIKMALMLHLDIQARVESDDTKDTDLNIRSSGQAPQGRSASDVFNSSFFNPYRRES